MSKSRQPLVTAVEAELQPAAQLELLVDLVQVGLDGALGDSQPLGDLLVAQAGADEPDDLDLTSREAAALPAGSLVTIGGRSSGNRGLPPKPDSPRVHLADALRENA